MKFAIGCVVLVAACGGDDGTTIDNFGERVIDLECKVAAECGQVADEATCKANATLDDNAIVNIIADVKAGIIIFDGDKLDACLDAYDDGCRPGVLHQAANDPCLGYLTGTVAQGGACFFSQECAGSASCAPSQSTCDPNVSCCAGTCGAPRAALPAIGAACTSSVGCAGDAYCKTSGTGNDGTCTALVATEGAACDDFLACADPLVCTTFSGTGTCYKPAAHGATCNPTVPLVDWRCDDERDYCDPTTTKCVTRLEIGAACDDSDISCKATAGCFGGTCVADAAVGAACDGSAGPSCAFGLECKSGHCAKEATGMVCRQM